MSRNQRNKDKETSLVNKIDNIGKFSIIRPSRHIKTLERIATPEDQLVKIREKNVRLVPEELLYKHGIWESNHRIYEHYDEELVCSHNDDAQAILDLITEEAYLKLRQTGMSIIHLGLIKVGIHGLHRKALGTKVLVTLVDNRHINSMSKAVIATIEADMNDCLELVYITPDFMVTLDTLYKNIKIIIQSHGYNMKDSDPNLLITKAFTGQISNNTKIKYTIRNNNIIEILGRQGIKAIEAKMYSSEENAGKIWNLDCLAGPSKLVPHNVEFREHLNGRLSFRMTSYESKCITEEEDLEDKFKSMHV